MKRTLTEKEQEIYKSLNPWLYVNIESTQRREFDVFFTVARRWKPGTGEEEWKEKGVWAKYKVELYIAKYRENGGSFFFNEECTGEEVIWQNPKK